MSFHILLAGIRSAVLKRARSSLEKIRPESSPWTISLIPSVDSKNGGLVINQVPALLEMAASSEGAVIVGVPGVQPRELQAVEKAIRPYFRYRRIEQNDLNLLINGDSAFREVFDQIIREETYWVNNVKPKDSYSPLMLPELFNSKHYSGIWRLAGSYNDLPNLMTAEKLVTGFVNSHKKKGGSRGGMVWMDSNDWAWDDRGPKHGQAKFPETWKYSLKLLEGLHFDVSHSKELGFEFTDREGTKHRVKRGPREYLNITPYGAVRGAPEQADLRR